MFPIPPKIVVRLIFLAKLLLMNVIDRHLPYRMNCLKKKKKSFEAFSKSHKTLEFIQ